MRINIYHHEIPTMAERGPEHVTTVAEDTGEEFHGIRFYTEPPVEHMPGDDDSSAVTFWLPHYADKSPNVLLLKQTLQKAIEMLNEIESANL